MVIGGGPAGTASAMHLLAHGFRPVIIEEDSFPRFHIGESLTTECVNALNRLGLDRRLRELSPPRKTGVRIFSSHPENCFYVGAGDAWQVERAPFDAMMLDEAIARGARHIHGRATAIERDGDAWHLSIEQRGGDRSVLIARFVIDASGQQRFCQKRGLFGNVVEGDYARQISFFSQFEGTSCSESDGHDTLIFHRDHHQWVWMIPLSETVTSIGLVVPVERFKQSQLGMEAFLEQGITGFSEPLQKRVHASRRIGEVRAVSNYSFTIEEYCRDGLFCVGDSHRFIDPIFSFGVQFAVMEAEYAARAIATCANTSDQSAWPAIHQHYMQVTREAQDVIQDLLTYFWAHPWGFANLAHQRFPREFLEIFAGRVYEIEPGEGLIRMREAIA